MKIDNFISFLPIYRVEPMLKQLICPYYHYHFDPQNYWSPQKSTSYLKRENYWSFYSNYCYWSNFISNWLPKQFNHYLNFHYKIKNIIGCFLNSCWISARIKARMLSFTRGVAAFYQTVYLALWGWSRCFYFYWIHFGHWC